MGLDMYLNKKYYVKNWDHSPKSDRWSITAYRGYDPKRVKDEPLSIPSDKITYIETEVAYWRKVNAIHKWFVENVQEGEDDCGTYYVEKHHLEILLGIVEEVLADHDKAAELLPCAEGFFFGGAEFDEGYFYDLEDTKTMLTAALAEYDMESKEKVLGDFYYHSSW